MTLLHRPPGSPDRAGEGYFTHDFRFFVTKYTTTKWKAFDNLNDGAEILAARKKEIETKIKAIYLQCADDRKVHKQVCRRCRKHDYLANGWFCVECYLRMHMRKRIVCGKCGEARPHRAYGLCDRCYHEKLDTGVPLSSAERQRIRALLPDLMRRQNQVCSICGGALEEGQRFQVDHIVPRIPYDEEDERCAVVRERGLNHVANLAAAHSHCNQGKGNLFLPPHPRSLRTNPLDLDWQNSMEEDLAKSAFKEVP